MITPAPPATRAPAGQPLLSVKAVTKSFAGAGGQRIPVLEGIDLEVADGEFVALLGRSGSGKSTLLRCIAGLIAPTSGEVRFRGRVLTGTNPGTAMVFQTFALLPWLTVQQNVELGLEARHIPAEERATRALRAIDIVGLDGYESAFPKELSGGMRQRVGFARALVVEPDVLLMDEPFSALDVLTAENLRGELLELWEGRRFPTRSVILVTHNIEEAVLLADRILVLGSNPGRIKAELRNEVPRPRHRRTPAFDALVDRIYGIMTERADVAIPPAGDVPAFRGTPGDTPLPHATVDGVSGMAEILLRQHGSADLADLARLLGLEVDHMFPLVDSLTLLGFGTLSQDRLQLTPTGEQFARAGIQDSKEIFAAAAIEHAPLVRTIQHALEGSADGNLPRGFFSDILRRVYSEEESDRQLEIAINWGRFAELFSFDASRNQLILEEHGAHAAAEPAAAPARRGALRIYLGAYPGAGKTFRMLRDGQERRRQGEDVVIGAVDSKGRPLTEEATLDLEPVPSNSAEGRQAVSSELDLEAVLARHPAVVLVDDLAHANPPGAEHEKRWQDVDALLDAGIDVMTTLDVGELDAFEDAMSRIMGKRPHETVPDRLLDEAKDIEFVDIAPTALVRRIAHGNVIPRDRVEEALKGPFRPEALATMRELALRLVARRLAGSGGVARLEPQNVLVAVGPNPHTESLIRRGTRLARGTGGQCTVLTVTRRGGGDAPSKLAKARAIAEQLGATFIERPSDDVARTIQEAVRELVADHLVIGESPPASWVERWRGTLTNRLIDALPDIDVHVIARLTMKKPAAPAAAAPAPAEAAPARRGAFRIYLGYARGCGTTMAMLDEARRRRARGTDVVVAAVCRCHPGVEAAIGDVPVLGGDAATPPETLDLPALMARDPQVACIDDVATAVRGGRDGRADLEQLLGSGITVIGTLHLADLRSTGEAAGLAIEAGAQLDDAVLQLATDVELVDVPPSVLIERVRKGEIVEPAGIASAIETEFAVDRLTRLREHAFRIVAWHAEHQQVARLRAQGVITQWEAKPRVMACVAPVPGMEALIRRAAALAASLDTDFRAVTVLEADRPGDAALQQHYAGLTRQLGGEAVTLQGKAVAQALADYARENLVSEMLASRGSRNQRAGHILKRLIRLVSEVDIHILAAQRA